MISYGSYIWERYAIFFRDLISILVQVSIFNEWSLKTISSKMVSKVSFFLILLGVNPAANSRSFWKLAETITHPYHRLYRFFLYFLDSSRKSIRYCSGDFWEDFFWHNSRVSSRDLIENSSRESFTKSPVLLQGMLKQMSSKKF